MALTWTFLRQGMELNAVQAAGVMENIMQESTFLLDNPGGYTVTIGDHVAYGLIQWKDDERSGKV